jgi:hypothetical protein
MIFTVYSGDREEVSDKQKEKTQDMCIFCTVNADCTVLYEYDIVALFPARRNYHYEKALTKQTTLRHLLNNFRYRILDWL